MPAVQSTASSSSHDRLSSMTNLSVLSGLNQIEKQFSGDTLLSDQSSNQGDAIEHGNHSRASSEAQTSGNNVEKEVNDTNVSAGNLNRRKSVRFGDNRGESTATLVVLEEPSAKKSQLEAPVSPDDAESGSHLDLDKQLRQLVKSIKAFIRANAHAQSSGPDLRARFFKKYKAEAEEFHIAFLKKYTDEMDSSLIFSGLFSAVNATFIAMMQPQLVPDPQQNTEVLLKMVIHSLNSAAFAGETLQVQTFKGPSTMTVWVQSLLYTSLAASLFAALGAVMGKQWLGHYAKVGDRGTVEERCIERQGKLAALHDWHFHVVLQCMPVLLQFSLLLFGVGMAAYMWDQQRAIALVLVSVVAISFGLFGLTVVFSMIFPDCPYYSPIADLVKHMQPYMASGVHSFTLLIKHAIRLFHRHSVQPDNHILENPSNDSSDSLFSLPMASPDLRPRSSGDSGSEIVAGALKGVLDVPLVTIAHTPPMGLIGPAQKGSDAYCVDWLLQTSTDPDVMTTAALMVPHVIWPVSLDLNPMLRQLENSFQYCWTTEHDDTFRLLPHARDRALACSQALLHLLTHRRHLATFGLQGNAHDYKLSTNWYNGHMETDDPGLEITCWALGAHLEPPMDCLENHPSEIFKSPLSPAPAFMEWFSQTSLFCLNDPTFSEHAKSRIGIALARFLQLNQLPHKRIIANCIMAFTILVGHPVSTRQISVVDKSGVFEKNAQILLGRLVALTQKESPLLQFRQEDPQDAQHSGAVRYLLKPFIDLLLHPSILKELHPTLARAEFHLWIIRLCRRLLLPAADSDAQKTHWRAFDPSQSYARRCLHMSVTIASPPVMERDVDVDVWRVRYERSEHHPDALTIKDSGWLSSLLRQTVPATLHHDSVIDEDMVADCLTLLSGVPNIGFKHNHGPRFFTILGWAMQQSTCRRIQYAAVRLTRSLCGHHQDVNNLLLTSLVNNMGGLDLFAGHLAANSPFLDNQIATHRSANYPWILAFLDIVDGLARRQEWLPHVALYSRPCIAFAHYLISEQGEDDWETYRHDNMIRAAYTGWDTDIRVWKTQQIIPAGNYRNTYIRDVLLRVVQIALRCMRVPTVLSVREQQSHSLNDDSEAAAALNLACIPWQIYDTHPLPLDLLPQAIQFSRETIQDAPRDVLSEHLTILEDATRGLSGIEEQLAGEDPTRIELQVLREVFWEKWSDLLSRPTSSVQ
ncbi:hypothetical protein EIP91_006321 [Steccherinum ochraceum]|uniref:DUF6535 domain-containing protein n=1 Tax=Steccherinum ochraceum TaxID=92696 RepID=A0A4R0RTM2_9APHY|nr:hypothetical protein EIP91_006321 [Steccherinum ochraceum]